MQRSNLLFYPLCVLGAGLPVLALVAPKGMAATMGVFGLIGLGGLVLDRRSVDLKHLRWEWLLPLVFLGYGAASWFWSLSPEGTLDAWPRLLGLAVAVGLAGLYAHRLAGGNRVSKRALVGFCRAIVLGYLLALVVLQFELITEGALYYNLTVYERTRPGLPPPYNQGLAAFVVITWPVLAAAWRGLGCRTWPVFAVWGLGLAGVLQGSSSTAALGMLGGGLALLLGLVWIKGLRIGAVLGLVVVGFGIPMFSLNPPMPKDVLPLLGYADEGEVKQHGRINAVFPRLIIWDYVGDRIAERPLLGWGLGSSKHFTGKAEEKRHSDTGWSVVMESLPLHPHNQPLQWWLELGLLGAVMILFGGGVLLQRLIKVSGRLPSSLVHTAFVASMVMACVNYSAWHSWWLGSLGICSVLLIFLITVRAAPDDGV
ncbi:MAG: O-antigen ligase family protein [Magnetovibrionaceae bacterium]